MLKKIKHLIAYFLGGIIFALFVVLVIVVGYLYYEKENLEKEVNSIKSELLALELKMQVYEDAAATAAQVKAGEIPGLLPVYNRINWLKLKNNMTVNEVIDILGNPTRIVSMIDTTRYIYKDDDSEGNIYFNRRMRVVGWNRF